MTQSAIHTDVIYSTLGADPELGELVEMFVDEMPDKMDLFRRLFESGDRDELCRKAHQLKGSAGSYGFDQLTPFAAGLEALIREEKPTEEVQEALHALVAICQKIKAGTPG